MGQIQWRFGIDLLSCVAGWDGVVSCDYAALQVWRSDTGRCVYEEQALEGAGPGGQATLLQVAPGGQTVMAATTDCRLRFFAPKVLCLGLPPLSISCMLLTDDYRPAWVPNTKPMPKPPPRPMCPC